MCVCVRVYPYLVVGEHSEDVQLRVWGKALTLSHTRDDSRYKCPMAQTCKIRCNVDQNIIRQYERICGLLLLSFIVTTALQPTKRKASPDKFEVMM